MTSKFTDCVWYRNGMRAKQKADRLSYEAAEPMFIVHDTRTGMYGVGAGGSEPGWCREARGFELLRIIRPRSN
jgi:hypothetical protein